MFRRFLSSVGGSSAVVSGESSSLTPRAIVRHLDEHVIGQSAAKTALALGLRDRWRRQRLVDTELAAEIIPKNILLVGGTGTGKTELARRIATLTDAPFVKVEATKFTEVGFHGRDVDTIIRDLVNAAQQRARTRLQRAHKEVLASRVEDALMELLTGTDRDDPDIREHLRAGSLDEQTVEVDQKTVARGAAATANASGSGGMGGASSGMAGGMPVTATIRVADGGSGDLASIMKSLGLGGAGVDAGNVGPVSSTGKVSMTVAEARVLLETVELAGLVSDEQVAQEALTSAQQDGIVFIDEIDKICHSSDKPMHSGDASNEGVQRDLLPLIEGTVVNTRFGDVDTSKILFIAAGSFYAAKVSDLLPELQGRLPVRVHLAQLTEDDMYRILTEPTHNLIKQNVELLATEGCVLRFTECGARRIAHLATRINATVENIGARRLHMVLARVLEAVSFEADERTDEEVVVDADFVNEYADELLETADLAKFIL